MPSVLLPSPVDGSSPNIDQGHLETASRILNIIRRYRPIKNKARARPEISVPSSPTDSTPGTPTSETANPTLDTDGTAKFVTQIYGKVSAGEPIRMCLPAFPFKSPNKQSKVLGTLPDKGEEFALAHLNGLCSAIKDVYPPGAELMIISDGLVYNDLLGVPDRDVWAYGETLRLMAREKGFDNIRFSRLRDLVQIDLPDVLDEMTYVANATNFRLALLQTFSWPGGFDASRRIAEDEDTRLTYRGYIRFLETDLREVFPFEARSPPASRPASRPTSRPASPGYEANGKKSSNSSREERPNAPRSRSQYKRGVEYIAKQMLARGDAFARAVRENFGSHIRLSIHPSTDVNKISVSPLPTDSPIFTTPWHCSTAFRLDGTVTTGHLADFMADDLFELVLDEKTGRPSHFRERSDLFSWGEGKDIAVDPIYPAGLVIRPANGHGTLSMADVDAQKVRRLAELNSPVVLRGFAGTKDRDAFVAKSREFGEPLPWKFGLVLEVKDRGEDARGLNNVLSAEPMPFHFDGNFKTKQQPKKNKPDELETVPDPPRFQFFTAVTGSPKDTGFTLFSTSTLLFKYLAQNLEQQRQLQSASASPSEITLETLRKLAWTVSTGGFNQLTLRDIPLVIDHPETGVPCLRYHEPWPSSKTKFEPTSVTIRQSPDIVEDDKETVIDSNAVCAILDDLLYDRRVCYYHVWEEGDLLISDNTLAMHTRSQFIAGCDRELWRIHFD